MLVAITSDVSDGAGRVPDLFAQSACVLLVESESGQVHDRAVRDAGGDKRLAEVVVNWNCEAILCGPLALRPFSTLADQGITRYNAAGMSLREALGAFERNELDFIRDHAGGLGCQGHSPEHS